MNNWRSAHATPLKAFQSLLNNFAYEIDENAIVVQRLKRLESITSKLQNEEKMLLSRMQDIGGCRVIVNSIEKLYNLYETLKNSSTIKYELIREKDYIKNPKESGYRGIHFIFKYISEGADAYNNMSIEVQLRTRTQHIWATAVETVGLFIKSSLKSSQGPNEWLEFFKLVSAVFAYKEMNYDLVYFNEYNKMRCDLLELCVQKEYRFLEKLQTMTNATIRLENEINKKDFYYVLFLRYYHKNLAIVSFSKNNFEAANNLYVENEKNETAQGNDIVLVSANTIEGLKEAYPNYFLNTKEFTSVLEIIINVTC